MKSSKLLSIFLSVTVTVLVVVFAVSADSWTAPSTEPPANNAAAPINTGDRAQLKEGGLVVGMGLDASQTALVIPNGNVNIGTAAAFPTAPNNQGGNASINDVYIRSVGKWASQLSASIDYLLSVPAPVIPAPVVVEPYVPPTIYYCGGLAYDNVNAYCQDGVIYNVGDWIPLDSHSNDQTDPRGNWSALISRPVTFPVKTCKIKADNSFNDGGFVTVFSGANRLGLWKEAFDLEAPPTDPDATYTWGMDQNNNSCAGPHVDPYMDGGVVKWCGYVIWRGGGNRVGSEYSVTQAKGSTATVYATHALGDGGDNHSYTLYGQFCN